MSHLTRRGFLSATAGSAAALGLGLGRRATAARASPGGARPNIILAMTDDQGWAGVGYEGVFPFLRTPHLDAMARSAVRFDRFYAAAPWCSPTRVSCMTGRCPARSNSHKPGDGLQPQDRPIAQVLRAQGYATGHFGKWHLGRPGPEGRGYAECLWTGNNVGHVNPTYTGPKGEKVKLQGEDCDLLVGRTLDFARRAGAAGRPFFVTLWFHVPHSPYGTTPEFEALYADLPEAKRAFWGQLSALDASMGKLRAGLRDLKVAENTLLWFHSDNGGVGGTSGDLRAAKGSLYEGGLRVPGLLEWPAQVKRPMRTPVRASTVDLLPTVLDALGLSADLAVQPLDGISLMPLVRGEMTRRPVPLAFYQPPGHEYTRADGRFALIADRYKLLTNLRDGHELYDLDADPREKHDLAARHPDVVTDMVRQTASWADSVERSLRGADYAAAGGS